MELIAYLSARGMQTKLAKELKVPQVSVHNWAHKKRPIPEKHCVAIEQATYGAVTRRDMHPDDWHLIWPELLDDTCCHGASPSPVVDGATVLVKEA